MSNVFTQTVVYLALLFLGYGFKKAGIFKVEDTKFLKSVILYITMPATAVNGLKDLELQTSFLWCFLIGFVTCTVLLAWEWPLPERVTPTENCSICSVLTALMWAILRFRF